MRNRRKLLATILVCSGVIASGLLSMALADGIAVACGIYLWIEYDLSEWEKMRKQITKEHGGFYY